MTSLTINLGFDIKILFELVCSLNTIYNIALIYSWSIDIASIRWLLLYSVLHCGRFRWLSNMRVDKCMGLLLLLLLYISNVGVNAYVIVNIRLTSLCLSTMIDMKEWHLLLGENQVSYLLVPQWITLWNLRGFLALFCYIILGYLRHTSMFPWWWRWILGVANISM